MQVTIGLGVLASLLLGCSGGVLNVGSNDAGRRGCALFLTDKVTFDAVRMAADSWTTYSPVELRSDLIGEWNVCFSSIPGVRSFHFTPDGRWTILLDEGDGGLMRNPDIPPAVRIPGNDGGATEYEGTYTFLDTFLDNSGRPVSTDGGAVSLVTTSSSSSYWFRPTFTTVMGQRVMVMAIQTSSRYYCAFVGP